MTELDDLQLSQRLRALRVDPPDTGFEARLATRLLAEAPEPAPLPQRPARVIVGPWLRRGPVRLIGATALFVAGAAAAVEGGVVEWVQARVQAARDPRPPTPPPAPSLEERASAAQRRERAAAERAPVPVEPPPAPVEPPPAPVGAVLDVPRAAELPPTLPERAASVPRLSPDRRVSPREAAAAPEHRPAFDPPVIPRLEIDRHGPERHRDADTRLGRGLAKPGDGAVARERGPELERIRDIAKARRERAADAERPRGLDRLRERRERINAERREIQERGRRDRQIR